MVADHTTRIAISIHALRKESDLLASCCFDSF